MTDFSDLIAHLRVAIELLGDLEPHGDWRHDRLLRAYQKSRYSLTLREARELELFLYSELERIHNARRYQQLDLLGGDNSA